jgi:heptosyltransferase II
MSKLPADAKKILIIREAAIGDVICMTPVIREVRTRYPNAEIDYVAVKWAADIVRHNPCISNLWVCENDVIVGSKWQLLWNRLKFFSRLASRRYDLVFCPTTQFIAKFILLLFRSAYRVGFTITPEAQPTWKDKLLLDKRVFIDLTERPRTRHSVEDNLRMLYDSISGVNLKNRTLEVFTTDAEKQNVDTLLRELNWTSGSRIVAIAPTAGSATKPDAIIKTSPPEKFIDIVRGLRRMYPDINIAFIGSKLEREYVDKMTICNGNDVVNLCGSTTLLESFEFLKRCSLLISNDSGAAHLGAAARTPQIAIFGATDEHVFGPYNNPNAVVLREVLPCAPCNDTECRTPQTPELALLKRPFCLGMISSERVLSVACSLLESNAALVPQQNRANLS